MSGIQVGLLFCLLAVFFQDWKYRRIHVVLPLAIFLFSFFAIPIEIKYLNILYNTFFFLLTLSVLVVYMSVKIKRFSNPFQNYFGFGDLLFYIAISPLFILQNYILFFILSMIFAIGIQFGLKKIIIEKTVPLAGFSSILLFIIIIKEILVDSQKITLL